MASGAARRVTGAKTGTGSAFDIKDVGFRPREIHLINVTSGDEAWWFEGMADASMYKRVAAGTGALVVTNGITPLQSGFTFGADTDMNVAAELVRYSVSE